MTTIVGIQGTNYAMLAADAMTSYDERPFYAKGMEKIVERGEYVFAIAGDGIAGDIANYQWTPPRISKVLDTDLFVMTKLLPSLRQTFIEYGYTQDKEDKESGFDMLLCLNGTIYQIDDNFGWMKDDRGLYAIGSGGKIALGALAALLANEHEEREATAIARRTMQISAEYNIYTGGETQIITQKRK